MEKSINVAQGKPFVSVVIPIYNTKKYLCDCLKSVCNQTLQNIEIICVNDGSTDGSEEIVDKFAKQDRRIRRVDRENGGLSAARNTGLACATGEYCYFLDSDDMIEGSALERLYCEARENQLEILFFGGKPFYEENSAEIERVFEKEKLIWERKEETNVASGEELFADFQLNRIFMSSVAIQLIKRNYLVENNLHFSEGYVHEDIIFTFEATIKAARVKCIKDCLFKRRLRADSIVTSKLSHVNFEGRYNNFIQSIFIAQRYRGSDDKVKRALEDFIKVAYNNAAYVYRNIEEEERGQIFKDADKFIYAEVYKLIGKNMV